MSWSMHQMVPPASHLPASALPSQCSHQSHEPHPSRALQRVPPPLHVVSAPGVPTMSQPALALTDQAARSQGTPARAAGRRGRRLATSTGALAIAAVAATAAAPAAHADESYTVR